MKYKLIERTNPQDRTKSKYYATPVYDGNVDINELADEIMQTSSLSRGDVYSVIENVIDTIGKYVRMGKSVSIGDLGTLRATFSSEGVSNAQDFKASMITGKKYIFTAGNKLKKILGDIHFELDTRSKDSQSGGGSTPGGGGGTPGGGGGIG
ncbi:MAG: HU family DNA-binding protein [Tannerellaceae bacterium]|jgi:predicted histone-like DNA-binding protein|nr:HU family DNA-binding protein [Tannerellaceae bacterium]